MENRALKRPRTPASRVLAISIKPLLSRAGVAVLLALSVGLVVMGRNHGAIPLTLRNAISDTVVPVINVLAKPVDALTSAGRWAGDMSSLREENLRLASDNARLRQWQYAATEFAAENAKLRALLKFAPGTDQTVTSARVAADTDSPYSRSVIISSGSDQNVEQDAPVISDTGLVGHVVDVGRKTARVLLLTDINSRIPVISQDSRERAIASGNNSDTLSLLYLPDNSRLKVGETVVTSSDGDVLPAGLPVGTVTKIEKGVASITPFIDSYRLEDVSVIDFAK